jgi:hypothetical protein
VGNFLKRFTQQDEPWTFLCAEPAVVPAFWYVQATAEQLGGLDALPTGWSCGSDGLLLLVFSARAA